MATPITYWGNDGEFLETAEQQGVTPDQAQQDTSEPLGFIRTGDGPQDWHYNDSYGDDDPYAEYDRNSRFPTM